MSKIGNDFKMGDMIWFRQGFVVSSSSTETDSQGDSDWLGFVLTDSAVATIASGVVTTATLIVSALI
jgi:hypothetical protein